MALRLIIFLLFFLAFCKTDHGQEKFRFKIQHGQSKKNGNLMPASDTFYIFFDYDYKEDIIAIKVNETIFKSDTLNAENLYGSGGYMKISKIFLHDKVDLFFNNIKIKTFRFDLNYSSAHLEYDKQEKRFTWRYQKYKSVYL